MGLPPIFTITQDQTRLPPLGSEWGVSGSTHNDKFALLEPHLKKAGPPPTAP